MTPPVSASSRSIPNPFATRYTSPSAGEYLFPDDVGVETLIARLREFQWWGQITGIHGSGKSTLVQMLLPRLEAVGRVIDFYAFRADRPPLLLASASSGLRPARVADWTRSTQIVVDGYEQLGWLQRTWWKWQCRRRGAGLLVTGHDDLGFPPLWRTETSTEVTRRVVARLLDQADAPWLGAEQLDHLFATHEGNVREVLFALYDLYEQRHGHVLADDEPTGKRNEPG
jgi:hypothetical protein